MSWYLRKPMACLVIKVIRDIGDDFCEQDLHEACSALEWVAEQLQFSMIADGIRHE